MNKLEVLVDAISSFNGYREPTSKFYRARNPLGLQFFACATCSKNRRGHDEGIRLAVIAEHPFHLAATGRLRSFECLHAGLLAALFDLEKKVKGESLAKLHGENFTLKGLMRAYNLKPETAIPVAKFLRVALDDQGITPETRLDYFCPSVKVIPLTRKESVTHAG